jgi:hypothetical protein
MTRRILFFMAAWMVLGLTAGAAVAQCDLKGELGRAGSLIQRTRIRVQQSGSADAGDLLRAASARLREAQDFARRGDTERACRLARVSQSLSQKAAEMAGSGGSPRASTDLERMLRATDQLLEQSGRRMPPRGAKEGRNLLRSARDQQGEAWAAYQNRRPRLAVKLTLMARESARRALRPGEGIFIPDQRATGQEMEQTERFLNEARRALEASGKPGRDPALMSEAERLQEQARHHLARGRAGLALSLTRESRVTARRALGQADLDPGPEDVNAFLESTQDLVARLEPRAAEARHGPALEHLDRARSLLEEAARARDAGRWREAFGATRAASALAVGASEMLDGTREE